MQGFCLHHAHREERASEQRVPRRRPGCLRSATTLGELRNAGLSSCIDIWWCAKPPLEPARTLGSRRDLNALTAPMISSEATLSARIRRGILECSKRANVGHIGSALSVADLIAAVYGGSLQGSSPSDPDRDRFILSKGHAAIALYVALHATGRLTEAELLGFCTDGSAVATHPEHVVGSIDFSTGSLGQGLSFGAGCALAARLQGSKRRAFVLMSDAECAEGAVWEAAMFAAHHRLDNVVALVDVNGQQALGYTRDILDLAPLSARWDAFGWDAHEVDGHDVELLTRTIDELRTAEGRPHVLLAHTTFGYGVSYMEQVIAWHYLPMSDEQYSQALSELEGQP
jgi:transketolase